jgi:hypothetical protein
VPVGVTGHQTQRPRGQVGPPGAHPAHPSSPLDPGGERWPIPIPRPLAPLIAQLVGRGIAGLGLELLRSTQYVVVVGNDHLRTARSTWGAGGGAAKYWPPFALSPRAHRGAGAGWGWSWGAQGGSALGQ